MSKRGRSLKLRSRTSVRLSFRQKMLVGSSIFVMVVGLFMVVINLGDHRETMAASTDDYRSKQSGNWNSNSTWQRYNGSSWVNATSTPSSSKNVISIRNGHTVTITANVTVDQLSIDEGGLLVLNSGKTMTIANGTGTDFTVDGTFRSAGNITQNSGSTMKVESTGTYQHNYTTQAGSIPTATWSNGSTCEIIGYTSSAAGPSNTQSFWHFIWNCTNQDQDINLNGSITTIKGNFEIKSTGNKELVLANNNLTMNVDGDFIIRDGEAGLAKANNKTVTLNIEGNFTQTGGLFNVVDGNNATGNINVEGHWTHTGGRIESGGNSNSNVQVKFCGNGNTQNFVASGNDINGNVDFTVNNDAVLNMSTYVMEGRKFTLSSGGELRMGSSAGITDNGSTGNIQTDTRSFSTGGIYVYNGSGSQVTGSGLPSTVEELEIDNNNTLTLTNSVSVDGKLIFNSGIIQTGSKEVNVTSSSSSAVTGHSKTSYLVGKLRRSVSSNGTYDFPLGTSTNYELATVKMNSVLGVTSILGTFTNSTPVSPTLPLTDLLLNNVKLDKMVVYGYWTLTPNLLILAGNYTVTLNMRGHNADLSSGATFGVVKRLNSLLPWQSLGTHNPNLQKVSNGTVQAVCSGLNSFSDFAIAYGEYLQFKNPTLISGWNGQTGAIYKFPDVCSNVDIWAQIVERSGGATLDDIDYYSGGYDEAFQPMIKIPGNSTASILWKLMFKVAGTSTDTVIENVAITGVDVDGGNKIREFVEATMPYSYSVYPSTVLSITNNNGNYRAVSNYETFNDIDTSEYRAMYQINYKNVSSFNYRTGAINTNWNSETRQTSLYFRSFFNEVTALPIDLLYFKAKETNDKVQLNWETASEINNEYFTVERSSDGITFEKITRVQGAGNSTKTKYYSAIDTDPLDGTSYYRLKQTDFNGQSSYSEIQTVNNAEKKKLAAAFDISAIGPNPFTSHFDMTFKSETESIIDIKMMNAKGQVVHQEKFNASEGYNTYRYSEQANLPKGMYYLVIVADGEKTVQKIVKE